MTKYGILSKLYSIITTIVQKCKWSNQLKPYTGNCKELHIDRKKTLVISPHADDELIGCYTYLIENTPLVFLCSMTGSKHDVENKRVREEEFIAFCKHKNIPYCISNVELKRDLLNVLQAYEPDRVLLPSEVDWHYEHRFANSILLDCLSELNKKPEIVWYQISVPFPIERVNRVLKMSDAIFKEKWNAFFLYYKSQNNINQPRFRFIEKKQYNDGIYEKYICMSFEQWRCAILKLGEIESDLDSMKSYINDLTKLFRKSISFYDRIFGGQE